MDEVRRLPAALAKGAMQRLTDAQQDAVESTQDWSEVEALRESLREHMTEIHRLRAALAEGAINKMETVEPVAYVSGFSKGYAVVEPIDRALLLPVGMALYRAPPKSKPLMKEERAFLVTRHSSFDRDYVKGEVVVTWVCDGDALIRAVERAHGIGSEE